MVQNDTVIQWLIVSGFGRDTTVAGPNYSGRHKWIDRLHCELGGWISPRHAGQVGVIAVGCDNVNRMRSSLHHHL